MESFNKLRPAIVSSSKILQLCNAIKIFIERHLNIPGHQTRYT